MITLTFFLNNALRPVRRDFPDDCTITIGRAATGPDLQLLGEGPHFELRARSANLSDDHARIVCRSGEVTLEDHHSRNGTFVRLDPDHPHPLDARPVRLGHDLVVVRDDPSRPLPQHLGHLAPEAFAAWLQSHLGDRLVVELTDTPTAHSFPLVGTALHLSARPAGDARTLDADACWWLRAVVNTWNASARPLADTRPWRFEGLSAAHRRALDLAQHSGKYSLQVAFYDAESGPEYRRLAEQEARNLRKKGAEAYFYHGDNMSLVTVGVFEDSDFVQVGNSFAYGDNVKLLQAKFPYNMGNGHLVPEKKDNVIVGNQPSFLVKVN